MAEDDLDAPRSAALRGTASTSVRGEDDRGLPATEQGRQTRQRVIDAALEEFAGNGFAGARVESITERAGVAYGTFYRYFSSKTDLVRALADEVYADVFRQATHETHSERPVHERVFNDYLGTLRAYTRHRRALRVVDDAVGVDPEVAAEVTRLQQRDVDQYAEIIATTPGYRPVGDPQTVSLLVNAMGDETARRWIRSPACTGDPIWDEPELRQIARIFALMCTAVLDPGSAGVDPRLIEEVMERLVPDGQDG